MVLKDYKDYVKSIQAEVKGSSKYNMKPDHVRKLMRKISYATLGYILFYNKALVIENVFVIHRAYVYIYKMFKKY